MGLNSIFKSAKQNIIDALSINKINYLGANTYNQFWCRWQESTHEEIYNDWFVARELRDDLYSLEFLQSLGDQSYLQFLILTLHPVNKQTDEVKQKMVSIYNDNLQSAGWIIEENKVIPHLGTNYIFKELPNRQEIITEQNQAKSRENRVLDRFWENKDIRPKEKYMDLYINATPKLKPVFAYLHQELDRLFEFLNSKNDYNRRYNAKESKQLLQIIADMKKLFSGLEEEGTKIELNNYYAQQISLCEGFLQSSNGSPIPEGFEKINIIDVDPVFEVTITSLDKIAANELLEIDLLNSSNLLRTISNLRKVKAPEMVIGASKDLIESFCKSLLKKTKPDLDTTKLRFADLVKNVNDSLDLVPAKVDNSKKASETIKKVLGAITNITLSINQLRNEYGSGHGKHPTHQGLNSRHSSLVWGLTSSLLVFWQATYEQRKQE